MQVVWSRQSRDHQPQTRWACILRKSKASLLALALAILAFGLTLSPAEAAWYDTNWRFRKQITIDFNQVDANLTNFPVLINLATDAELAANAQADGDGSVANAQLNINPDAVWALLFSVKIP